MAATPAVVPSASTSRWLGASANAGALPFRITSSTTMVAVTATLLATGAAAAAAKRCAACSNAVISAHTA